MKIFGGGLVLVTGPTVEPVTLAEAKAHLRVTSPNEDTIVDALITTAREQAEIFTRRAFLTQTFDYFLDGFPAEIRPPRSRLQDVVEIVYRDIDGNSQTVDPGVYLVDSASEPGRITLAYNQLWPTWRPEANVVRVRFTAGYGDAAEDLPKTVRLAMLLTLTHWFENRGIMGAAGQAELPMGAENLLWSLRPSL